MSKIISLRHNNVILKQLLAGNIKKSPIANKWDNAINTP